MSETLTAALSYAIRGWRVLPVNGKIPILKAWVSQASTDPERIRAWWTDQNHNVGIATGKESNLFVLDVDPDKGGNDSLRKLEDQYGELPETIEVLTGGWGRQYYFQHPGYEIRNSAGKLGPGLDIRSDGGQVVAPPSIHPTTGRTYVWEVAHHPDDVPIAPAPAWLLALLKDKPVQQSEAGSSTPIPDGRRNQTLTSLAGSMRRRGMSMAAMEAALLTENTTRCRPPLSEEEVRTIAASVAHYTPAPEALPSDGKVTGSRGKLHPALHFDGHGAVVGIVTEAGQYVSCTSTRLIYSLEEVNDQLLFPPRPYPDLIGRWADTDITQFVTGGPVPSFSEVLTLAIKVLRDSMEFPRSEHAGLVAAWAVGSYFFPLFLTFPRLNLSGERESGKSKLMTALKGMAFNALLLVNPTPAVLFRLIQEFRATMLLDEVEGLNKEDARDVLGIINSGYKAGGTVPRCEGKDKKRVESFNVYAPLALAAIKNVNPTTEDRCIPLTLQRSSDRRRINAEIDLRTPIFAQIRSGCYGLLLTRWRQVEEAYQQVECPEWLNGRTRELWRPLLTVVSLADQENGLALAPDLLALAKEHVDTRTQISAEGDALLHVLTEKLDIAASTIIHPGDLTEGLKTRLGWQHAPTPELVASWLRRFRFSRANPPRDREGVRYEVTSERLHDLQVRYGPPEPTHLHLHHPTN